MATPLLLSVQVGMPREHGQANAAAPQDRPWRSGIFKAPVAGPVPVHAGGLAGDGQADTVNHGGVNKAALAYAAANYDAWRADWPAPELPYGGFGENLTVAGLDESSVCVGDAWQVGDAVFEVSQPRQPCWKLNRRWGRPDLAKEVVRTGRTGWYLRVLQPGAITAGMPWQLQSRPRPEWTIARANAVFYGHETDPAALEALAWLPELSMEWREPLLGRLG